ncbi:hypothetical protein ALC62_12133 [Cyphomyrmex costatus]|uniref:Uncharacterized protein n=1 Tax=Cyphomyrmex costatus TaxID=456900 RepID=A0A151IBT8_9HYME|nr:hypothetical protein ALC62_12133 [Cyphomyrmex costatus]
MRRLCIPPQDSSHTYNSSDIAAQLLGNSACLHLFAVAICTNVPPKRTDKEDKEKIKKHAREITPFLRERSTGKEIDRIPPRSTEQPRGLLNQAVHRLSDAD